MITLTQYWMGRDKKHPPGNHIRENATDLLHKVNALLDEAGAAGVKLTRMDQVTGTLVSSGYRPSAINERTKNAAKRSTHLTGHAVDIQDDQNQSLARFCLKNLDLLSRLGLWMEDPRWTFSDRGDHWVHLQSVPPGSGARVYRPNMSNPRGPRLD